jgi:hypothetical protein
VHPSALTCRVIRRSVRFSPSDGRLFYNQISEESPHNGHRVLHNPLASLRPKLENHQRTLSSLYKLNFSSQVTTGIFSHTAWAMICRSNGSAWCRGRSKR